MNDHRQNSFHIKFNTAGNALGVAPEKIVSLKIRDCVNSYSEYREMVHSLEMEFGVHSSDVIGELQGRGYLLIKQNAKVIIVEHETGLEILYIAGSIASLIALIPMILQAWNAIRRFTNPRNPFHAVEVRRLDEKGELHENTGYSRFFMANTSESGEELKKSKELLGWESGVPTDFLWWSEAAVGCNASRRTALRCRSASPGGDFWLAAQAGF